MRRELEQSKIGNTIVALELNYMGVKKQEIVAPISEFSEKKETSSRRNWKKSSSPVTSSQIP
jgi:hypothetical protein